MLLAPLLLLSFLSAAHAQIVTSSFNRSQLAVNPSSAATRYYGYFSATYARDSSLSKISETRSDGKMFRWKQNVGVEKKQLILTAVGRKFVPELFLSFDEVSKNLQLPPQSGIMGQKEKNKVDFVNNLINLAYRYSPRVFWGIKFFNPKYNYNTNSSFTYPDSTMGKANGKTKNSMLGIGAGVTLKLTQNIYFGAFYTSSKVTSDGKTTNTDFNGKVTENESKFNDNYTTKGMGFSYKRGDSRKSAFRTELSYSLLDYASNQADAQQANLAMEISCLGLVFGGNFRMTKGNFRDNMSLLKDAIQNSVPLPQFTPSYEYFIAFSSERGHSIGINGFYNSRKDKTNLFGIAQPSKIIDSTMGITYSYTFY